MSIQLIMMKAMMKKQRGTFGRNLNINALREAGKESGRMPAEKGAKIEDFTLGGVDAEIIIPENMREDAVVLYIHGGGFVSGSGRNFHIFTSYFAINSKLKIYSIDYRLAPEHPFPAGPNDCLSAYKALTELEKGKKIILLGESAGANLVLVTTLEAKDADLTLPAGIVAYAPLTDASGAVDSSAFIKTDLILGEGAVETLCDLYCPNEDLKNPYISPYYGNYDKFPPLRIVWDAGEQLCPDNRRFVEKLKKTNMYLETKEWQKTFHTFEMLAKLLPEARNEISDSINFINKVLGE